MHTQEPVHTNTQQLLNDRNSGENTGQNSGLQVLCLEVERQLNRHYKRVLAFFVEAFSDRCDYPLTPEQALMLFCISNGVRDTVQICRTIEPVTSEAVFILAKLYAQGYVTSSAKGQNPDALELTTLALTIRGQAVADGLYELYNFVFLNVAGKDVPDTARLASMHVSLRRLQNYDRSHALISGSRCEMATFAD